jgi:hypothetical protein
VGEKTHEREKKKENKRDRAKTCRNSQRLNVDFENVSDEMRKETKKQSICAKKKRTSGEHRLPSKRRVLVHKETKENPQLPAKEEPSVRRVRDDVANLKTSDAGGALGRR